MGGRYRTEPNDLGDWMKRMDERLKALEAGPRASHTSVDSGAFVIQGNGGSTVFATGEQVPQELIFYYQFFGWTIINVTMQKKDDLNYTFNASVSLPDMVHPVSTFGVVKNAEVRDSFLVSVHEPDMPMAWLGATQGAIVNIGNVIVGESKLVLANARMFLGALPLGRPVKLTTQTAELSCNSALTLGTSAATISGCQALFETKKVDAEIEIVGTFDFECTVSGTAVCRGSLVVDGGAAEAERANFAVTTAGQQATVAQTWYVTIPTPGLHSADLQALKSAAAGTMRANTTDTKMSFKLTEM